MKKVLIITDKDNIRSDKYRGAFHNIAPDFIDDAVFSPAVVIQKDPSIIIVDMASREKATHLEKILKEDFSTAYIPVITFFEKAEISRGVLDLMHGLDDYMLRPVDPVELKIRADMAIKRSRHRFYANPLTGLPGGIVIEEELQKCLEKGDEFVACHIDIDNFKSFNDKYGYLKGDRVIMQTAYMLNMAIRTWGDRGDFLGQIGGDDFVVVTTPEKYDNVFRNFICMFDTIIPFHYSEEDRKVGYVEIKDRLKMLRKIPLMSVTVAMVIKNSPSEMKTLIEINDRIAEVKQYLKKLPGSKYMADRRILKKDDSLSLQVFNNHDEVQESYKPLGQLLIEKNIITYEELDKALKEQWRRGVFLGEVLKELSLVTEDQLEKVLKIQAEKLWTGNTQG